MQGTHLYEYAVIRVVPRVEREEFLNVGIILFCKREKYIRALFHVDTARLQLFNADLDIEQLELNLHAFELISQGTKKGGPMAMEDIPERFRWLTAIRSSAIQTSRPHPGLCNDLDQTVQRLLEELVL